MDEMKRLVEAGKVPAPSAEGRDANNRNNGGQKPRNTMHRGMKEMPSFMQNKPAWQINLYTIFTNNAEIRRYVSNSIINEMSAKGLISPDVKHKWVDFRFNKYRVEVDDLSTEYRYTNPIFVNAFMAAIVSFASAAQDTLNTFLVRETGKTLDSVVDDKEVEVIVTANATIQSGKEVNAE